jgi:photosystem II stability/assembly factor-like uncharacterized protein
MRKVILCLISLSLFAPACGAGETVSLSTAQASRATSVPTAPTAPAESLETSQSVTPFVEQPIPSLDPGALPTALDDSTVEIAGPTPVLTSMVPTGRSANPLKIEGLQAINLIGGSQLGDNFYALTPVGLYITRDGGLTWAQVTPDPLQSNFVFSPAQPGTLYAGAGADCYRGGPDQPFYKSVNGGATWSELPTGVNLRPVAVLPSDPNRIWAFGCASPAYSSDGGDTWTTSRDDLFLIYQVSHIVPTDSDGSVIYIGGVSEGGSGVVARSQDGGTSWTRLLQETPEQPLWWINDLLAFPWPAGGPESHRIFLVDPHGVWRSYDGGVSWNFSNTGLDDVFYQDGADLATIGLNALAVDGTTVYLGTAQGVYQSLDEGETWTKLNDDLGSPPGGESWENTSILNLVFAPSPRRLFITTAGGVYVLEL